MWSARRGIKTVNLSGELQISEEIYFNHSAALSAEQKYCMCLRSSLLWSCGNQLTVYMIWERASAPPWLPQSLLLKTEIGGGAGECRIQKVNTVDDSTT